MPVSGYASADEVDDAKLMFATIRELAETFAMYLKRFGTPYEHSIFLEHRDAVFDVGERLKACDIQRSDLRVIIADGCVFFAELTEWVAMHAVSVEWKAFATADAFRCFER